MTIQINGALEIDQERGVIYFHSDKGVTVLRICSLPKPIPNPMIHKSTGYCDYLLLDITHMYGTSWHQEEKKDGS